MYYYERTDQPFDQWAVKDESNSLVAGDIRLEVDAKEIVAALNLVERIERDCPEILGEDGKSVNGGDLVDVVNDSIVWTSDGRYHETPHD